MANQNIGTPRFYTDQINFLMSRGIGQDGNFDVITGANLIGIQTGSEAELFDMRPLNKVDFDTSANTSDHVLINIDTQSTSTKKSFVAILNHNCNSADAKIRIRGSDTESHVNVADMASANYPTLKEIVNGGTVSTSIVTPATDGSTIVSWTGGEQTYRYWGIQFEGNSSNTFSATDLFVGCIMIGEYYEMPHAPDMNITRIISYNRMNDLQESHGGQRFSNLKSFGRTAGSTSKSPFTTASNGYESQGGRLIYDMNFSFLDSSDLMPDEYDIIAADDNFVDDVWNMTNGNHIPFIFSIDKSSEGDNAESEHIFGRFANNSLDMAQVAPNVFNVKLTVEEEF
jgi:hypothetical protein